MAALNVLDQLIAAQPESVKPVLAHISGMLKSSQLAFDNHVGENESIFGQVQVQISAQADRISEVESWTERAANRAQSYVSESTNSKLMYLRPCPRLGDMSKRSRSCMTSSMHWAKVSWA